MGREQVWLYNQVSKKWEIFCLGLLSNGWWLKTNIHIVCLIINDTILDVLYIQICQIKKTLPNNVQNILFVICSKSNPHGQWSAYLSNVKPNKLKQHFWQGYVPKWVSRFMSLYVPLWSSNSGNKLIFGSGTLLVVNSSKYPVILKTPCILLNHIVIFLYL